MHEKPSPKRRITYVTTILATVLAGWISYGDTQSTICLVSGLAIATAVVQLWTTRSYTITVDPSGNWSSRCELCQSPVELSGASLLNTIRFAHGHAKDHAND